MRYSRTRNCLLCGCCIYSVVIYCLRADESNSVGDNASLLPSRNISLQNPEVGKTNSRCTFALAAGPNNSLIEFPLGPKFSKYLRTLVDQKNLVADREFDPKQANPGRYLIIDGVRYSWDGNFLRNRKADGSVFLYRDQSQLLGFILRYLNHEKLRQQEQGRAFRDAYTNVLLGIEREFEAKNGFRRKSTVESK